MGYAIVVDVSVARSAGVSGKPEPEACRRSLLALMEYNHRLVMNQAIREEWFKLRPEHQTPYASLFAQRWLVEMQQRGRVQEVPLAINSMLRQRCVNALREDRRTSGAVAAVEKDFHLVETALQVDRRVISLDMRIVNHLAQLKESVNEICPVMWVHPVNHHAEMWLQEGAPEKPAYYICQEG